MIIVLSMLFLSFPKTNRYKYALRNLLVAQRQPPTQSQVASSVNLVALETWSNSPQKNHTLLHVSQNR